MARVFSVAAICGLVSLFAGTAAAQAPIVYAGQGAPTQTASLGGALAGGGEGSYGYARPAPAPAGAIIDIRRVGGSRVSEGAPPPPQSASVEPTARPDWLEEERVGPPYEANGRWYVPTPEPGYSETGIASWYGPQFHGRAAANGETFDQEALTAAHPTLPLNSLVQVTNLANGREVIVRVTDRGPFVGERLIDMSRRAAEVLGFEGEGQTRVHVRYLGPAPRRLVAQRDASAQPPEGQPMVLTPPAQEEVVLRGPEPMRAPPASSGGYYVQVGAFSALENAQRVREAVIVAGSANIDVRTTASGAELFRVRVGPWQTRSEAESARMSLASLGYPESVVAAH